MGKATVQISASVWETLSQTYGRIHAAYNLDDPLAIIQKPSTLRNIIEATFDRDELPIVTKHSQARGMLDDSLDDTARARVLAQAIAGIVTVLELIVSTHKTIDADLVRAEIRRFGQSSHRQRIAETMEGSHIFGRCYDRSQIAALILGAVKDGEAAETNALADDEQAALGWASELPSRNMGVPGGFTILALN